MSTLSHDHIHLNESGIGKCSVPMFAGGCPVGFCDEPAYGERPESTERMNYCTGRMARDDGKYAGYVPGLACSAHGGPKSRVFKDGDSFCSVCPDFTNIQESICGFGDTPENARAALIGAQS